MRFLERAVSAASLVVVLLLQERWGCMLFQPLPRRAGPSRSSALLSCCVAMLDGELLVVNVLPFCRLPL